jgi:hypothetical protein
LKRFSCKGFELFSIIKVQGYGIWRLKTLALLAELVGPIQEAIDELVIFQVVWLLGSIYRLIQQALCIACVSEKVEIGD